MKKKSIKIAQKCSIFLFIPRIRIYDEVNFFLIETILSSTIETLQR